MPSVMTTKFIIYTGGGWSYKIESNPDSEETDGSDGVHINYSEDGDETYQHYIHIDADSLPMVIEALQYYVDKMRGVTTRNNSPF